MNRLYEYRYQVAAKLSDSLIVSFIKNVETPQIFTLSRQGKQAKVLPGTGFISLRRP
jgi:hypothetical protein